MYNLLFVDSRIVQGSNSNGQLANLGNPRLVPTLYPSMSNVKSVSFGFNYILILKNDGTVFSCGSNGSGQLGDGTNTSRLVPVKVLGGAQGGAYLHS